jgi:hypothetical protein
MNLLAVDPGVDNPAFALFRHSQLMVARRVQLQDVLASLGPVDRCEFVANQILTDVVSAMGAWPQLDALVVEQPQFYRASKSKGDPNKLALLVLVCGSMAAAVRAQFGRHVRIESYYPAEWAGQIPKSTKAKQAWKSPRGRLIRGQLSEAEFAAVQDTHDAVDAVGIGLRFLDRLIPPHVYPGAR